MPPSVSPISEGVREETDATVIPLITEWLSGGGGGGEGKMKIGIGIHSKMFKMFFSLQTAKMSIVKVRCEMCITIYTNVK